MVRSLAAVALIVTAMAIVYVAPAHAGPAATVQTFSVSVTETGLWPGWGWNLSVNGTNYTEVTNATTLALSNGTYNWSADAYEYNAAPSNGTITVGGANSSLSIAFTPQVESIGEIAGQFFYDLPIGGNASYHWTIFNYGAPVWVAIQIGLARADFNLTNTTPPIVTVSEMGFPLVQIGDGVTLTVNISIPNSHWDGGESWHTILSAVANYNGTCGGGICISGGVAKILYGGAFFPYPVTFTESGLPTGTLWSVGVNGGNVHPTGSSMTKHVSVSMPNGTFPFYPASPGYSGYPYPGTVVVNGSSVHRAVEFAPGNLTVGRNPDDVIYDPSTTDVYVANYNSSSVTVVGQPPNSVLATLRVGQHPIQILYDPVNQDLYVLNSGSGNVTIINATNTIVGTVKVGARPSVASVDPASGTVYVTCPSKVSPSSRGTVSVVDPHSFAVTNISVGASPGAAVYDPANGAMFVANRESGTISVLDSTAKVATISVGAAGVALPGSLAFSNQSREMYVAVSGSSPGVDGINASNRIAHRIADPQNPGMLLYDRANHDLYVVDNASSGTKTNLTVIAANDTVVATLRGVPGPHASALMYDSINKRVYVLPTGSGSIAVVSSTPTPRVVRLLNVGSVPVAGLVEPSSGTMAVICTASPGNLSTVRVYSSTNALLSTTTVGESAGSFAYQGLSGYIYVANYGSFTLSIIP